MNQRITVSYTEQQLPSWMMEQLTIHTMNVFFPASFLMEKGGVTAVYQTEGYRPLAHAHHLSTEEVFQMLCQLMSAMEDNEKHYLFSERYLINAETVFIDPLKNRIKMIYLPNEEALQGKIQLCQLALFCKSMIDEEGRGYLDSWVEGLQKEDHGYRSAIRRCELLMQEIYVCDIP